MTSLGRWYLSLQLLDWEVLRLIGLRQAFTGVWEV